jgi:hypothetical protein
MQAENRRGLIALLPLIAIYLAYVMFAVFEPGTLTSAPATGALSAAVGSFFLVLALLGVFSKLGFPNWLVPAGHPLATGLIGAAFLIIGAREFFPASYRTYFQIAPLLLMLAAAGFSIRARGRRDDHAANSFVEMLTKDRGARRPASRG